jgi:hypothetical protein
MSGMKRFYQIFVLLMGLSMSGFFVFMGISKMSFATQLEKSPIEAGSAAVTPSCTADPDCANHTQWAQTWMEMLVEGQRARIWEARTEAREQFHVAVLFALLSVLGFVAARFNDGQGRAAP